MEYIILFPIFLLRSWHVSRVFKTLVYWLKKNNQIQDLIISLWKFTYGYLTTNSTKMSQFWMLPTVSFAPLWSVPRSYRWQNTKRRIQQRTQRQGPQKQTLSVRLSALADMWILAIWPGSLSSSRAPLRKSTLSGLSVDTQEVGWLLLAGRGGRNLQGWRHWQNQWSQEKVMKWQTWPDMQNAGDRSQADTHQRAGSGSLSNSGLLLQSFSVHNQSPVTNNYFDQGIAVLFFCFCCFCFKTLELCFLSIVGGFLALHLTFYDICYELKYSDNDCFLSIQYGLWMEALSGYAATHFNPPNRPVQYACSFPFPYHRWENRHREVIHS